MSADGNELWSVRLPNGEVSRGSLDQLDEAFNAGHIDEHALVLAPGSTRWTKLGDLAGLDDAAQPASVQPEAYTGPQTLRPMMTDLSELAIEPPPPRSKMGWVIENEPQVAKRARWMMLPGDYIALRLSGTPYTTASGISEMALWDFKAGAPAYPAFDAFGSDERRGRRA